MQDEQIYLVNYQKGFNEGYLIATHLPVLSRDLAKTENNSPRCEGIRSGINQYALEQVKVNRPAWLKPDKQKTNETDKAEDKEKNQDREQDK